MAAWCGEKVPTQNKVQEWFLRHPEFSYEWFETGRGSMFHARNAVCARMTSVERLALVLELFGIREVHLWTDLCIFVQRNKTVKKQTMKQNHVILFEQAGKYALDISKLIFGGIIIVGIMQKDGIASLRKLYIFATLAVVAFAITGFMFYYYSNVKRKD